MILYDRLWQTMKEKNISQYALINKYKISAGQLTRLRKNESVTTHTIDMLCDILNCNVEDVMEYQKDSSIQK
ncbi:MAG: helix-turn-helix transcriptional regulator [Lachnospiraceae bacterium]|nr:helix-turn-helix transcriptional regulator [Lachnospiraceae bacterium]